MTGTWSASDPTCHAIIQTPGDPPAFVWPHTWAVLNNPLRGGPHSGFEMLIRAGGSDGAQWPSKDSAQKVGHGPKQPPNAVPGGHEHRIERIAQGTSQPAAVRAAIRFHVTDNGFDGAAAFELALQGFRIHAARLARSEHPHVGDGRTLTATIHMAALGGHAGQDLGLLQRLSVPITAYPTRRHHNSPRRASRPMLPEAVGASRFPHCPLQCPSTPPCPAWPSRQTKRGGVTED